MSEFEDAKAFLMKDYNGSNLFDHIAEVLLKVLTERPENAVAIFEQLSATVKNDKFNVAAVSDLIHDQEKAAVYCKHIARLIAGPDDESEEKEEDQETEEPLAPPRAEVLADLEAHSSIWSAAGINIDDKDLFKLQLALARLAGADDSIQTLRLWGRMFTRSGDYFVAEGVGGAPLEEPEGKQEPEEEANKHTYWVCSFPGDKWVQLPPVRPQGILCARQIKRFLTGDLDAQVLGYPAFPGKERDYVRAVIALINADCAVAPKGYFALNEEDDTVDIDEEFTMGGVEDLATAEAWQVYGLDFSSVGMVKPIVSEDEEGNEISTPEGWAMDPLRSLSEEQWAVRRYPNTLSDVKGAKVILSSLRWPGAVAVASPTSSTWTNFYVGYGAIKSDTLYTPPMPPALQKEFDASTLREQPDVVEDPSPAEGEEQEEE